MDKSWLDIKDRANPTYIRGVDGFLEWAFTQNGGTNRIRCPCKKCVNVVFKLRTDVRVDLLSKGFWDSYKVWDLHGEVNRVENECETPCRVAYNDTHDNENLIRMVCDAYGVPSMDDANIGLHESEEPNVQAKRFFDLLKDAETELYPGCSLSKLSFIVKLLQLKCLNHWSNKSMDLLLALWKESLPEGALVPPSFYDAKKIVRDLGLDYKKIDACENDCILYWGEHENAKSCPKCKMPRWKLNKQKGKKVPHKVLRHFPIKPRLQRLYMAKQTAKDMRWHKEKLTNDDVMRHPTDSLAWKHFDQQYPSFSADPRSVRLGLASDGFQPFGNMSANHSIWPVVLIPYNLPPWLCMKSPYFMMALLIPGPKCPGDEIDVYLQPLIEELKQLWELGAQTYDAHSQSNFNMRVALLWTINDFPAYGNLSGWSTKGKLACPCCHKDTHCISLRSKLSYMGHRRFLPQNHPWRQDAKSFDGKEEHRAPPIPLTGDDALLQLEQLGNVSFGKGQKRKRYTDTMAYNWRKRSIFFQLPYWKILLIRHNLDVMHIERNVSDNILSTIMDLVGKTKDTMKSRYDLKDLGIRSYLHPVAVGNNVVKPHAPYTLSLEKKQSLCKFLANIKVPDAFASNISRCVNIQERKIFGLKCHDHHVLLEEILPIAIRGLLPPKVSEPIIEMGKFFKNICSKSLTCEELDKLQSQIALTLCKLETIFPPAFFDVMVHLPIHLVGEAKVGGPVQYRWMYPIERYLRSLKSCVRNKARPEGSIAEGYLADESLTFCSRYLKDFPTKFNIPRRNDDIDVDSNYKFSIFKKSGEPRGRAETITLSHEEYFQAKMYVLQNCEEVWPLIEDYKNEVEAQRLSDQSHYDQFPDWLRSRVMALSIQGHVSPELESLSIGPLKVVNRYSMFIGNGFRFHTKDRASGKKTQNSGVMVKGDDTNADKEYYGVLEHIYELSYIGNRKIYLFKCHWWDMGHHGKGFKVDKYGFTSINTQYSLQTDEPFILASQAGQVFYVDDIVHSGWLVVVKTSPRDLFNMPIATDNVVSEADATTIDEDAYQQLVVDLNIYNAIVEQPDIVINLGGDDLQPQTSIEAVGPSQRSVYNTIEVGFIDDRETHSSSHEDSDEEDVLDDNDTDTEVESGTRDEIEDSGSDNIYSSDSVTEDSIE